ncbi:hypothetical protein ACHAPJ_004325 [Fusarium lateritium]
MKRSRRIKKENNMSSAKDLEVRQSPLLRLPTEILLMIVNDESLEYDDIRNLGLVSVRLHGITRKPFFQGPNLRVFRAAAAKACVKMMKKCAAYDAAPTDVVWAQRYDTKRYELVDKQEQEKRLMMLHWYRPIDLLLSAYLERCFPADQCIEALKWLIDNGYQVREWVLDDRPSCIPSRLLRILSGAFDKEHHQGLCDIIHVLHDNGLILQSRPGTRCSHGRTVALHWVYEPLTYGLNELMVLLMQSACPASVLELYLKQLDKSDMRLTSRISDSKRPQTYPGRHEQKYRDENPCTYTPVSQLVELLFDDLFDPYTWKAEHPFDMAQTLDDKISLLVKYQGIIDNECGVLKNLVAALRKIGVRHGEKDGIDLERDGVWCWYELCMSIKDAMKGETLRVMSCSGSIFDYEEPGDDGEVPRLHEFCATRDWDPMFKIACLRGMLAQDKLKQGEEVDWSMNFNIVSEVPTDPEWWNMPLESWYGIYHYYRRRRSTSINS